ncbi:MAG: esterase-like activity of phytase family protein [Chloroflexota bacterium]
MQMTRRPVARLGGRRFPLRLALLVSVCLVVTTSLAQTPIAAQGATPFDLRAIVPASESLPPGFTADAGRTVYEERASGEVVHELRYVREESESNLKTGPVEIGFAIARTASTQEATRSQNATRDSLTQAGWAERPVPLLGDEALGFGQGAPVGGRVAFAYVFRFGRYVLGTTVVGRSPSTTMDDAIGMAIRFSAKLDTALAQQPSSELRGNAPPPTTVPSSTATAPTPGNTVMSVAPPPVASAPPTSAGSSSSSSGTSSGPSVSVPTIVADASLADAPEVGDGFRLGGFSGLFSLDKAGTLFATLTDRGPNGEIRVSGKKQMAFPVPEYTPRVVRLKLEGSKLKVTDVVMLKLAEGYTDTVTHSREITGLPGIEEQGDVPFDPAGKVRLPLDPNGVDSESIALDTRDGSYWIGEEYGPSILHVAPDGTIRSRLVPVGYGIDAPGEGVIEMLPSVLTRRKVNRGFEGIALSPDGSRLFAIMQSPLSNPDKKTGEASRNIRIVVVDSSNADDPKLVGMYVYRAEAYTEVGAIEQDDVKIGDIAALTNQRLLVGERDSAENGTHKKVYRVDLDGATDVTDRGESGGRTIEQMTDADFKRAGIEMVRKSMVVDLATLGYRPDKLEGLAVVDPNTLAVINDNDFGIASIDDRAKIVKSGAQSRLIVVRLPDALR